jgi:hypothetical protein
MVKEMSGETTERAFESAIEEHLLTNGYTKGTPKAFDRARAIDAAMFLAFVKDTQPRE